MANSLNNVKIALRSDSLQNWTAKNPVLKNGELAIVVLEDGGENIKLGNGLSSFNQLQYLYQNRLSSSSIYSDEVRSNSVAAKSISQGISVKSTPTSLATGVFAEADGNFDVVHGIEAKAKEGDDYAFVWNGVNLPGIDQRYFSHGEGSFSVNPVGGLSGFYIGETSIDKTFVGENGLSVDYQLSSCVLKLRTSNQTLSTIVPRFANTTVVEWDDEFWTLVYEYGGGISELSVTGDLRKSDLSGVSDAAEQIEVGRHGQVSSIGAGCFAECPYAREIRLPASVVSVGSGAFGGLTELSCVRFYESTTEQVRAVLPQDFSEVGISSDIVYNKYGEVVPRLV